VVHHVDETDEMHAIGIETVPASTLGIPAVAIFLDSLICRFSRANVVGLTQERLGARAVYSRVCLHALFSRNK
jgi:hypothetical protein